MSPVYFFKPRIVVGRSGNFLAFCLNFFLRVVKLRLFLRFSWKPIFPFEKFKLFLVTNEDLKLVSLFGRKDCGLFGGKIRKRNEISLRRKNSKQNAEKLLDRATTIRGLKKYTGDIRPLTHFAASQFNCPAMVL